MKKIFPLIFILAVSILISLPLLKAGLYIIHDDQQIARLYLFDHALKTGQFPVRWVDELGFGFGYPLFVFYPPLVYMIGEIFHLVGFGFIDSIKLVFFTSIFLSGLAMYILAKELWGKSVGIISALFYILVPYRALDIYVRGALAESFSFVWLPLILWSFYKLAKTNRFVHVYVSAAFLALLMITHNLIFLAFMLILPFYLLFLIWKSENKKFSTFHFSLSVLLAFGLSAFFWIPSLFEKKFTIVDQLLLVNLANFNIHFVYPMQPWNWPWGFGGSASGLADGISFKIGKLHIILALGALILAVAQLIKSKQREKFSIFTFQFSILFFALFLVSAFMTTFYSKPIWNLIPPLGYVQFPWRFLIFTSLFSSLLTGVFIYLLKLPILRLIASLVLLSLLLFGNFKLFKPQSYRPDLTDEIATSKGIINWEISQSSFEYLPKGVRMYTGDLGTNLVDIQKGEIPKQKLEILSGTANVENFQEIPSKINFTIKAKDNVLMRINTFNFPGWQAQIDGNKTPIGDNNKLKLITFNVGAGIHQVNVEFKNTPVRILGNLLTIATILISAAFVLGPKWRNFKNKQK